MSTADEMYREKIAEIATRLRRLAEEVERDGVPSAMARRRGDSYLDVATGVVHTLVWGFANLHLDILISRASRVDKEN